MCEGLNNRIGGYSFVSNYGADNLIEKNDIGYLPLTKKISKTNTAEMSVGLKSMDIYVFFSELEHNIHKLDFNLKQQILKLQNESDSDYKPVDNVFQNAIAFVDCCNDSSLLLKASAYLTDHATVVLKVVLGTVTSSIDIGRTEFTYSIVNTMTIQTLMGRGRFEDQDSIHSFYSQLKNLTNSNV